MTIQPGRNLRSTFLEASRSAESTRTLRLSRRTSPEGVFLCYHHHQDKLLIMITIRPAPAPPVMSRGRGLAASPGRGMRGTYSTRLSSSSLSSLSLSPSSSSPSSSLSSWGRGRECSLICIPHHIYFTSDVRRGQYSTSPSGRGRVMMNR